MIVNQGDTITILIDLHGYRSKKIWSKGDKLVVRTSKEIEPRKDRNNELGVWFTFEGFSGSYWFPLDYFACREHNLKILLDE